MSVRMIFLTDLESANISYTFW